MLHRALLYTQDTDQVVSFAQWHEKQGACAVRGVAAGCLLREVEQNFFAREEACEDGGVDVVVSTRVLLVKPPLALMLLREARYRDRLHDPRIRVNGGNPNA